MKWESEKERLKIDLMKNQDMRSAICMKLTWNIALSLMRKCSASRWPSLRYGCVPPQMSSINWVYTDFAFATAARLFASAVACTTKA